jgi:glycosyltransferase involved in cell wall biosynthesis
MRILLLDQFSDPGGAQQVLLELLPAIGERGWKALVGLPGEGEMFQRVRALGFEAERIDCGPYASGRKSAMDLARFLSGTPRLARQIEEMASRVEADLVYVNGPRLLPAAAKASLPAPVLFHAHSYLPPGATRILTGMCLWGMRAWVLGSCRFVADPWRQYVVPERLSVIYNGVTGPGGAGHRPALSRVRSTPPAPGPRPLAPAVGCIGRIAPEKRQREFLAAASIIHGAIPDCRFIVYGAPLFSAGDASRYDAEVRAASAGLPVEFPGWVTDVFGALSNLDLLLVPSAAHEATTRVILEAFAAGVPVIAFRAGGIPEVVDHNVDGLLAGSTEEMARMAIDLLTGDPARLAAMSQAARESWRSRFTLEAYHRKLLDRMQCIAEV